MFSKGPTDLGCTNLVEHEIKLKDETPFKEAYRRIPYTGSERAPESIARYRCYQKLEKSFQLERRDRS